MASEQEVTDAVGGSQAPRPVASAGATAAPPPSLLDEYDLGDTSRDPSEVPSEPAPTVPGTSSGDTEGSAPSPPRDPNTGRFLKADEAPKPVPTWLRREANDLGISDDEIAVTDPQVLTQSVLAANRALRKRDLQDQQARLFEPTRQRPEYVGDDRAASVPSPVARPASAGTVDADLVEFPKEWDDPEQMNPAFAKPLKAVFTGMAKQIADLKRQLGQIDQRDYQREVSTVHERIDRGFAQLPAKFKRIVGDGDVADLNGADADKFKRTRKTILASLDADPIKGLSVERAIIKRTNELYGDLIPDAAPPKAAATPAPAAPVAAGQRFTKEEWAQMGLGQPSGRIGDEAEPPSEQKAIRNLARRMKEQGLDPNGDGPRVPAKQTGDDGLLD